MNPGSTEFFFERSWKYFPSVEISWQKVSSSVSCKSLFCFLKISNSKNWFQKYLCWEGRVESSDSVNSKFVNCLVEISGKIPSVWGKTIETLTVLGWSASSASTYRILAENGSAPKTPSCRGGQSPSDEISVMSDADSRPGSPLSFTALAWHWTRVPDEKYILSNVIVFVSLNV